MYAIEEAGCMIYSNMYYSFFELDFYISDGPLVVWLVRLLFEGLTYLWTKYLEKFASIMLCLFELDS